MQPISKLFQEDRSCWLCLPGPPDRLRENVSMNNSFTAVKISFCWVIAIITVALTILRASYKTLSHEQENIRLPEQQLKSQGDLYESGWSGVLSECKCQDYVEMQCWDRCKEANESLLQGNKICYNVTRDRTFFFFFFVGKRWFVVKMPYSLYWCQTDQSAIYSFIFFLELHIVVYNWTLKKQEGWQFSNLFI